MSDCHKESKSEELEDDEHTKRWRALLMQAYDRFHVELRKNRGLFPGLSAYDPVDRVAKTRGTFAWHWGAASEFRETVNSINSWGMHLHEWTIWNIVIDTHEVDRDKWELLDHFIEPVAFYCMMQPSSFVDRLMITCENLLHQANQYIWQDEPDRLDQDGLKSGQRLGREARKEQLDRLGERWPAYPAFRQAMRALDAKGYRNKTRDFRNLTAHSFAPRLMMGHVSRALRSIVPWNDLVEQPDGSFLQVEHPTRKGVQYAMADAVPMPLPVALSANRAEYQRARAAMTKFAALVEEICDRMDQVPERPAQKI